MTNLQSRGLLAFAVLAAGSGLLLALPGTPQMLRAVLGVYLVLVAPGFALTSALLPNRRLGTAERALAAIVASIAIVVLGGLVLNLTPGGLQPASWCVLLASVTAAATLGAWLRLRHSKNGNKNEVRMTAPRWTVRPDRLALPLVAAVLLGLAVTIARMPAPPQRYQGYTTLWMVPNDEQAATGASIGVQSGEFEEASYRLEVRVNGQLAGIWPGLRLEPNQQWQTQLALPETGPTGMVVEAFLYRTDVPRIVYRQARFKASKHGTGAESVLSGERKQ